MTRHKGIGALVEWAILHKKILYFLVGLLCLTGLVGIYFMDKDEYPSFEIKQGLVVGIYPGAGAQQVEDQLVKPIEDAIFGFKEVARESVKSVSLDGKCFIYVDLGHNIPQSRKDEIWSKIKLRLQQLKMTLPSGVLAIAVIDDFSDVSATILALRSSDKGPLELMDLAEDLSAELRALDKTASVSIIGPSEEEIAVTIDRDALSAYGIDPNLIMALFRSSTLSAPSGLFSTQYASSPVHVGSTVTSEKEIADRIIYSDPAGGIVRLRDVASIERRLSDKDHFVSLDGEPCVIVSVVMRPKNDIVAYGREIDRVLEKFNENLPPSVSVFKVTDQPKVVSSSVFSFLRDLLISMLVVVLVMLLLFPLRSASIASSGLPVITAVTLAIMFICGIELNTVTLAALITVLGMIVDDSIITMDGYMDKLGKGYGRIDAACASAKELFLPTFIATLAISTMFFPVPHILIGYLKDFVWDFPWIIAISLMVSLMYAVTVVPSLEVKYIDGKPLTGHPNLITRAQNALFGFIERVYAKAEEGCFKVPAVTLLCGAGLVGAGIFMFTRLNLQMMPMAARDYFVVEIETQGGLGLDRTIAVADSLESILEKDPKVRYITSFAGVSIPRFTGTYTPKLPLKSQAQLVVKTRSSKATEALLLECQPKMEFLFPEALVRFKQIDYQAVEAPITIVFHGDDREEVYAAAEMVKRKMMEMDDVLQWVHSDADNFESVVSVDLDADESARLGVDKTMVALQLAGTLGGLPVGSISSDGKDIPVRLYSAGITDNMYYEELSSQLVATSIPGVSVPLRQVSSLHPDIGPVSLVRLKGGNTISIYADMKYGCSQPGALRKIQKFIRDEVIIPDGVEVSYEGLSMMNRMLGPRIQVAFWVAVAILFIFLLIHFRKVSIALLTMVMSSVCMFGAFFGLWLFNLDMSITGMLGLISLVGIIVRNGILLYDYAEDRRFKHGDDVRTAALEAGKRRVRPIFLTSCTTALGVLPMIISGDNLWQPMGVVICFGTMLSIVFIVLLMPVSYWVIFKNK